MVAVLVLAFLAIAGGAALVVRRLWSATAEPGTDQTRRLDSPET